VHTDSIMPAAGEHSLNFHFLNFHSVFVPND